MASSCSSSPSRPSFPSCFNWRLLVSSSEQLSFRNQTRTRRRTFNQLFTKTGVALVIGVIIMAVFPYSVYSRPTGLTSNKTQKDAQNVYVRNSQPSHRPLAPFSRQGSSLDTDEDEVTASDRFESRRNNPSTASSQPASISPRNYDLTDKSINSFVESSKPVKNSNVDEQLDKNNSSMVVRVIVTSSSSSTSSGSVELDETDKNSRQDSRDKDDVVYVASEDEQDRSLIAEPSSEVHVSTLNPEMASQMHQESSPKTVRSAEKLSSEEHLELKKLAKESETPDIFSAFYHAFAESANSQEIPVLPQKSSDDLDKLFLRETVPTETTKGTTVASFRIPFRPDYRQRPSSFQLFQQRRRLFRTRQLEQKLALAAQNRENGTSTVEETARKLEFLAKKLDKSEDEDNFRGQHDKVDEISSSLSSFALPTQESLYQHSSSPNSQVLSSLNPGKVAVSVTHTKSVVASGATTAENVDEEGLKKNAKSETTFSSQRQEGSKIHGSYSYFTRPRPLIKSLPRNESGDKQNSTINNKNKSHNHIFPRNFSTHDIKHEENGMVQRSYDSGLTKESSDGTTRNVNLDKTLTANGNNDNSHEIVRELENRDIFPKISKDGSGSTTAEVSKHGPTAPAQVTTFRPNGPQKRKITRTVASEIGDPSSHYFNINVNYGSPSAPRGQPSQQTSSKSPNTNWQQPEKIWSEPAQVWSVPAKIWGEPERVWSEPSKIWSNLDKKKPEEEMLQSDQPPEERKPSDEEDASPPGTFVILGEDENEGDSIDGDLGRPLMLHHFTIPQNKQKETVSVSSSVTASVSSNKSILPEGRVNTESSSQSPPHPPTVNSSVESTSVVSNNSSSVSSELSNKKSGKKFGYVIEGANVRKYRVEERTPDGYIVGEYGVLNNQNAFLRGVRYTADGTINPRLIHEALMKFLSLRR